MKNLFKTLTIVALLACGFAAQAQNAFPEGTKVFQAGVGLFGFDLYNDNVSEIPLISLSYEQCLMPLGPGTLGVGGYVGYKTAKWDDSAVGYDWRWTWLFVGARGAWHPDFINSEKWDAYIGLLAGLNFYSGKFEGGTVIDDFNDTDFDIGGYIGARYYFSEKFGIWAEGGYGLANLNVGVAIKL
jgi:hypothetical protein